MLRLIDLVLVARYLLKSQENQKVKNFLNQENQKVINLLNLKNSQKVEIFLILVL